MRTKPGIAVWTAAVLLAALCPGPSVALTVKANALGDLAVCRTVSWTEGKPALNSIYEERIHLRVEQRLRKKRMEVVTSDGACSVSTHVVRTPIATLGILQVQLVHSKSEEPIWVGQASDVIDDPRKAAKQIDQAVKEIFAAMPKLDR